MKKHKLLSLCMVVLLVLAMAGTVLAAEETYTITYHLTGGVNGPANQEKAKDVDLTLSSQIPTREGYEFMGWASWQGGSVSYQPGDTFTDNYSQNLYAVWESQLTISLGQTVEGIIPAGAQIGYSFTPETDGWYGFAYTGGISSYGASIRHEDNSRLYYEAKGMEGRLMTAGYTYTFIADASQTEDKPFTLTVTPISGPTGVAITVDDKVTEGTASQIEGYDLSFDADLLPAGYYGDTFQWSSSNTEVGELDNGWYGYTFTGNKPGKTTVTVTTGLGFTASCEVTVKENPVSSITAELRTKLYEGLDGSESWDGERFYYEIPRNFLYITLHYKDGTSETFSYGELEDTGYRVELDEPEVWQTGANECSVSYLGVTGTFTAEVVPAVKKDLPASQITEATGFTWEQLGADSLTMDSISHVVTTSDIRVLAGSTVDENWNYTDYLAVTRNDRAFTQTLLEEILRGAGVACEGRCYVNALTALNETVFISYTHGSGSGLLKTTDGETYEKVDFPYNDMEIDEMVEAEYYPAKRIFRAGDTYVVMCSQYHYYTSPDLVNWTKREFPEYDWSYKGSAIPTFSVAAATDTGLYLLAGYNFGPTTEYAEEGIFFTSDFVNYRCITEELPMGTLFYTQPMERSLQGDRIAIVSVLGDYEYTAYGYHNIRFDIYDEQTGKLTNVVNTDSFISNFNFNLGGYDPVQLITRDKNQDISYFISSQRGEIIASYELPVDARQWKASIKTRWSGSENCYYADIALYGDTLYVSGDYYKTVHAIQLPEEIAGANIKKIATNDDEDLLLLIGKKIYACPLSAVKALLQPAPVLTEETSGVSVIPVSPDAVPAGAAIMAEIVGQDAQTVAYEINLSLDGSNVQPAFPVYVKLPIPVEGEQYSYKVYRVETDGSKRDMEAYVEDGYLWFVTDHFSRYEIKVSGGTINPFEDVKRGDQFEQAILWAYYNNITKGTSATMFSPENACTRKQIVTFLWRAAGQPEPESMENPFTDVKRGDQFEKAILWAYYKGITKGTSATEFSPEKTCTRKQIVTFLWRYNDSPAPESMENPFNDVKRGDQFEKAILWAYYKGITKGTSTTEFSPENPCTRKQIVTFLYRDLNK